MSTLLREPWTVERFLAWEDKQEGRHEFDGACITELTGGSRAHQRLVFNLLRLLADGLDPARFDAAQEMRFDVGGKVRYPDLAVVAGRIPDAVRTLRDAVVLFEVLSEDTAAADRGIKRQEYARLPSIRRYVLLEQDRKATTVLTRTADGWAECAVTAGTLDLPEVGVRLPLDDIYRGLQFA